MELYRITFFFRKEGQVCTKPLELKAAIEFKEHVKNCFAVRELCCFEAEGMDVFINLDDVKCTVMALVPEPVAELPPVAEPVVEAA